jgi:hypothetical protein
MQHAPCSTRLTISLPRILDWTELVAYIRAEQLSGFSIPPDTVNFNYYVVEVPLSLIVPSDQQLVQLPLTRNASVVAYDLAF